MFVAGVHHEHKVTSMNSSAPLPADKPGKPGRASSGAAKMPSAFASRNRLVELFRGGATAKKLFDGMQVRMGVATGYVETQTYGRDGVKNSPLHEMAKREYYVEQRHAFFCFSHALLERSNPLAVDTP